MQKSFGTNKPPAINGVFVTKRDRLCTDSTNVGTRYKVQKL